MQINNLKIDGISAGHVQGIAVDADRKYVYYSFTTAFIKTDINGNIVGSVTGLVGHLGCIAYNKEDGRVYGSLEYKRDAIGNGILARLGSDVASSDGFYVAVFDVDRIDRKDMDAEGDGVMSAVHLDEVLEDYSAEGHKYGCSGIDGITFAPLAGQKGGKRYLYVAYGIYGDISRNDNDHQIILRYDISEWKRFARPLKQNDMHHTGPAAPDDKYFVYTGNTRYGIQNLEYDEYSNCIYAAVYKGKKEHFPNYAMFAIDMSVASETVPIRGTDESGKMLMLAEFGTEHRKTGIYGSDFKYGATGMASLGEGYFLFSEDFSENGKWGTVLNTYRFDGTEFEKSIEK